MSSGLTLTTQKVSLVHPVEGGSEILATSSARRRFNVGSDSSSNENMNIRENDSRSDNEWTNVTNHDIIPQEIQFSSGSRTHDSQ